MKLTILTEILSTHSGSRAPIELARNLARRDQVTLMCFSFNADHKVKKELEDMGVKVFLSDVPKFPFGKWLSAFRFLPRLKKQDLISFHGTPPSFLVAKISGIPIVENYYGSQLDAYLENFLPNQKPAPKDRMLNWLGNQLTLAIEGTFLALSDGAVANSQYTSTEAKRLYGRTLPFVLHGASLEQFASPKPIGTLRNDTVNLLSVSRITPYKGFHLLIEAIKKMRVKCRLFIVGSAPKPKYLSYLEEIGNASVEIFTDISDSELAYLYQHSDIYVSCDRYLFFGLPIIEAALFEKPSVVLDYCAAREVIEQNETGFVAKNLPEFTKYVELLINNPNQRTIMGQRAKVRAQKYFLWKKSAEDHRKLFVEVRRKTKG